MEQSSLAVQRISEAQQGATVDDPVLRYLAKRGALTERQLQVLLAELDPANRGKKMAEKAARLGVTKGTYAKVLQQALRNVTQSVFTVLLISYLGLAGEEGCSWLVEVGQLLREGRFEEAAEVLEDVQKGLRKALKDPTVLSAEPSPSG
jgi:hypothetical protein